MRDSDKKQESSKQTLQSKKEAAKPKPPKVDPKKLTIVKRAPRVSRKY